MWQISPGSGEASLLDYVIEPVLRMPSPRLFVRAAVLTNRYCSVQTLTVGICPVQESSVHEVCALAVGEPILKQASLPLLGTNGANDSLTGRVSQRLLLELCEDAHHLVVSVLFFVHWRRQQQPWRQSCPRESLLNGRLRRKRCR